MALGLTAAGLLQAAPHKEANTKLEVRITVDSTRQIRTVPATLFGTNVTWRWNGFGAWLPQKQDFNPSVIRHTRLLAPSLLRFPGGTFGDHYNWKKAVGPFKTRTSIASLPGDVLERPHFGTDEALAFARRVGGQLLIVVNVGTGTPELAAQWVHYINKKRCGEDRRNCVTYWELGNELYHKPTKKNRAFQKPEQYAKKFMTFARAMRAVDPSIKLGAIGLENFGRYRFNSFPEWNRIILERTKDELDFFSQHNAYAPVGVPDHVPFEHGYQTLLAAPVAIKKNLQKVAGQLRRHVPLRAKSVPIAVTEWGPMFHAFPKFRWLDHSKTLGAALFVASLLQVFIETPEVSIANQFKLLDFTFNGLLGIEAHTRMNKSAEYTFLPTTPYYAFCMIKKHEDRVLIATKTEGPTFGAQAAGWTQAIRHAPYVEATTSIHPGHKTMLISVVNKSSKPANIAFRTKKARFGPRATIEVLTGKGLDAHTGTGPVQVPKIRFAKPMIHPTTPQHPFGGKHAIRRRKFQVKVHRREFKHTVPGLSVTTLELPYQ